MYMKNSSSVKKSGSFHLTQYRVCTKSIMNLLACKTPQIHADFPEDIFQTFVNENWV